MVLTLVIGLGCSLPGSPLQSNLVPLPVDILYFPSNLTGTALSEWVTEKGVGLHLLEPSVTAHERLVSLPPLSYLIILHGSVSISPHFLHIWVVIHYCAISLLLRFFPLWLLGTPSGRPLCPFGMTLAASLHVPSSLTLKGALDLAGISYSITRHLELRGLGIEKWYTGVLMGAGPRIF